MGGNVGVPVRYNHVPVYRYLKYRDTQAKVGMDLWWDSLRLCLHDPVLLENLVQLGADQGASVESAEPRRIQAGDGSDPEGVRPALAGSRGVVRKGTPPKDHRENRLRADDARGA